MIGLFYTGTGHLTVIESAKNSSVYQSILKSNRLSIWKLNLGRNWVMRQKNNSCIWINFQQNHQKNHRIKRLAKTPIKVKTSTSLKCCGGNFKQEFKKCSQTSINRSNTVKKNGPNVLYNMSTWWGIGIATIICEGVV